MASMTCEAVLDPPCPRVTITVMGLPAGESVVSLWRTTGREDRIAVRGARGITVVDSFLVEDFGAPLGRDIRYELEYHEGGEAGSTTTATVMVDADHGYIQDPLNPSSAVPVHMAMNDHGEAVLSSGSFAKLTHESTVSTFSVSGSSRPTVIGGTRQAPTGIPLSLLTEAAAENDRMRELVSSTTILLVRPLPSWAAPLPPSGTYAAPTVEELPAGAPDGEALTVWDLTLDVVRPSSARIIVALFTYQDVEEMFSTYARKQEQAGGGTYLDDQRDPSGGGGNSALPPDAHVDGGNPGTTIFDSTLDGGN